MGIEFKGKEFCVFDLVFDTATGKLSTSKIGQWIANLLLTNELYHVRPLPGQISWEYVALFSLYAAIVGGSTVATNFLKWRFRDSSVSDPVSASTEKATD